jgi:hypothetical protein
MGNPFFLPDVPERSSSGAVGRVLVLTLVGLWVALSVAALVLTLTDVFSASRNSGPNIAEMSSQKWNDHVFLV